MGSRREHGSDHCILDDNHNLVYVDLLTWAMWLEHAGDKRIVGRDVLDRYYVSTVFLGLDHDYLGKKLIAEYGGAPEGFYEPLVFETMVFENAETEIEFPTGKKRKIHKDISYQKRYRRWDEAVDGHNHTVKLIRRYERMLAHRSSVLRRIEKDCHAQGKIDLH